MFQNRKHDRIKVALNELRRGEGLSQSREDYVKFIYEHSTNGGAASNKMIAQGLQVAPPSVSEMIHKLANEGLVSYRPYYGANLTEAGESMAKDLLRKHEIWEYFLEHKLDYTKEEVHELAEILEHSTPLDLADRLAKFIEYPIDQEFHSKGS